MTWMANNKSEVITSYSSRLSTNILQTLILMTVGLFGFIISATADVVSDRRAGFKESAASMKAIRKAIGGGDYETVIQEAEAISSWARKIPSYFPEGSGSGDTKARNEIWINFDDFTALSRANENRAKRLITAAKSGDQGAMMSGVKNLGISCKSCHKLYKE